MPSHFLTPILLISAAMALVSCANRNTDNFASETSFDGAESNSDRYFVGEVPPQSIRLGANQTILIVDKALGSRLEEKAFIFCLSGARDALFIRDSFKGSSLYVCDEAVSVGRGTSLITTTLSDGRKIYLFHVSNLTKINVADPGPKFLMATGPIKNEQGKGSSWRIEEDTFEVSLDANGVALIDSENIANQAQTVEMLKVEIPALSTRQFAVASAKTLSCDRSEQGVPGFVRNGFLCSLKSRR